MNQLKHLAIIPDGNRRWAKKRRLASFRGHLAGYKRFKQICDWCLEAGIKFLTIYSFSYENWQRQPSEVAYLMKLFLVAIKDDVAEVHQKGFKLKIVGRLDKFPATLRRAFQAAEKLTQRNTQGVITLCLSYGGQPEIVDAIKKIISQKIPATQITAKTIQKNLYSPATPPPDLIIRTGGQHRLSNFLTWQSIYSELHFTQTLLPDFSHQEFKAILEDYHQRQRRFGK